MIDDAGGVVGRRICACSRECARARALRGALGARGTPGSRARWPIDPFEGATARARRARRSRPRSPRGVDRRDGALGALKYELIHLKLNPTCSRRLLSSQRAVGPRRTAVPTTTTAR